MTINLNELQREKNKGLNLSDFSFAETQELLKDCKTSFAEEVIEERYEDE
jgi:hypothetical protein